MFLLLLRDERLTLVAVSVNLAPIVAAAAGVTFRLEFFANDTADPSGNGEGEVYLGHADVTTDGSGTVWMFVGTDSGFESRSSVYYTRFVATFESWLLTSSISLAR